MAHELDLGNWRLLASSLSLESTSSLPSLSRKLHQGCNHEILMWWRDYQDWVHDWTQLRPLFKLLRYWWAGAEICLSCGCPSKHHKFSCLLNQSGAGCLFSLASPCPLYTGAGGRGNFRYHQGSYSPDQGLNSCPLKWKQSLNHWASGEVLLLEF